MAVASYRQDSSSQNPRVERRTRTILDRSPSLLDIRTKGPQDKTVRIWRAFQTHQEAYLSSQDHREYGLAKRSLSTLIRQMERGQNAPLFFLRKTDDSAAGALLVFDSGINPRELFHSPVHLEGIVVKKLPPEEANQSYADSLHALHLKNQGSSHFNVAEVFPPYAYRSGHSAITLSQLVVNVELDRAAAVLSASASNGNPFSRLLKEEILRKNLEDAIFWQRNFSDNAPSERPEDIQMRYLLNIMDALKSARELTYHLRGEKIIPASKMVDGAELQLFQDSLQSFSRIVPFANKMARLLDNSPNNSGFAIGTSEGLDDAAVLGILNQSFIESGKISRQKIDESYYHWDTAGGKYGHMLEDAFHVIDSYSFGLSREEQRLWVNFFLSSSLGQYSGKDFQTDIPFVGAYRSLRKRALIIQRYAALNERSYDQHDKSADKRDAKRRDYEAKAKHYMAQAVSHLNELQTLFVDRMAHEHAPREVSDVQRQLAPLNGDRAHAGVNAGHLRRMLMGDDPSVSPFAQIVFISYLVRKLAKDDHIYFDCLRYK